MLIVTGLFADWDQLFMSGDDPSSVENVNVITGNLNLCFKDVAIEGAYPFEFFRTYSSSGAFENKEAVKIEQKNDVLGFHGGWSFLSHLFLLVDPRSEMPHAYLMEPSGAMVSYKANGEWKQNGQVLLPTPSVGQCSGVLCGRKNPANHKMILNVKKGKVKLYLADGGMRIYRGEKDATYKFRRDNGLPVGVRYYKLEEETLSSGHKIFYRYDQTFGDENDINIRICNPGGDKTLSWLDIRKNSSADGEALELKINANNCDGTVLRGSKFKERMQITSVISSLKPDETVSYKKTRKGAGYVLESLSVADQKILQVEYYAPPEGWDVKKTKMRWAFEWDKVKTIRRPSGIVATFTYQPGLTCVRDAKNILTRYHYSDRKLDLIEYCDEADRVVSSERFFWREGLLIAKAMCDGKGLPIVSKTFEYDGYKNVIQETLYGSLTGLVSGPFSFDDRGGLIGAESYSKWYRYDERSHLLIEETEEDGAICRYAYLDGTDLLTYKGNALDEERLFYDKDHLLIEKRGLYSLERYKRDPKTGMVVEVETDFDTIRYTYNEDRQVIQEEINGCVTTIERDQAGRVVRKTFPTGAKSEYVYDHLGNTVKIKEAGSPCKYITYDAMNWPIACESNGKRSSNTYDKIGKCVREENYKGEVIYYRYDAFGRCVEKSFPKTSYEYDIQGNLVLERSPSGCVTKTYYNVFKKPVRVVFPDGSEIRNIYYKNGELKETVAQDLTKTVYEYDTFHRLISKNKERWEYEGALLKRYTNEADLVTTYNYDQHGRKIEEICGNRRKEFVYDALGYLERVIQGERVSLQIHDKEGRIVETSENGFNRIRYTYDEEGRKVQAIKTTSAGEAVDRFSYDEEGRLISHTDPLGNIALILYANDSKTIVDALGNRSVDTFDRLGRVTQKERQTPLGKRCFLEEFCYDEGGNLVKRLTTIYEGGEIKKSIEVVFAYDCMGRLIEEVESGQKRKIYRYDIKGRLISKTSPDGVIIDFRHDDKDRLVEMKSSEGSVHYIYEYDDRGYLVSVRDEVLNRSIERCYNQFGEILEERGLSGCRTFWDYDAYGRVIQLTLPDKSAIAYTYVDGCMESVSRLSNKGKPLYVHKYTKFDANKHVEEENSIYQLGQITSKRDLLERPVAMISPFHEYRLDFGPTGFVVKSCNSLTEDKKYDYDPLNQLIKEGKREYRFDSLGNATDCVINDLNQVVSTQDEVFVYDLNGNMIKRNDIEYTYDALNRLISITQPNSKKIVYTYDPLSRLFSKETSEKKYYIYDRDFEIGTLDEWGNISELKVQGLGISGDIGAAIAIELDGEVFAPLHDFQGNILALIDRNEELVERYDFTAFGEESLAKYRNPWRFASKRQEEGLIFFGKRFYDPRLKRFITPDPLGFADGRNLYAYTFNSPLNRLDQFGLEMNFVFSFSNRDGASYGFNSSSGQYINMFSSGSGEYLMPTKLTGFGFVNGVPVQMVIICKRVYDLNFSPEEYKKGTFDFGDHLHELISNTSGKIHLITYNNGINTSEEDWLNMGDYIADVAPEGALIIGIYNPTEGLLGDLKRVGKEVFCNFKSYGIDSLHALHTHFLDFFDKHSPQGNALHIAHSEGGLIYNRSFQGMKEENQRRMQQRFYYEGIGPAEPAYVDYGIYAKNTFSYDDYVTGLLYKDRKLPRHRAVDIEWVAAISPLHERTAYFADHAFLGSTYKKVVKERIDDFNTRVGFYVGDRR